MTRQGGGWPAAVLALALLAAPALAAVQVVDDAGRTVRLAAPAQRIVSLAPHATELLAAAGAGAALVAVDRYSNHPPMVQELPRVGDAFNLNLEAILALQPDLVVAWQSALRPAALRTLEGLGLTVYLSEPATLAAIPEQVAALAALAGTTAQAQDLAPLLAALPRGHGAVPAAVLVGQRPLLAIGSGHVLDDLLRHCGARNVFAGTHARVPRVSLEALLQAAPALLVVPVAPGELAAWQQLLAPLANARLVPVAADLLARPGPRLLQAAATVCAAVAGVANGG